MVMINLPTFDVPLHLVLFLWSPVNNASVKFPTFTIFMAKFTAEDLYDGFTIFCNNFQQRLKAKT